MHKKNKQKRQKKKKKEQRSSDGECGGGGGGGGRSLREERKGRSRGRRGEGREQRDSFSALLHLLRRVMRCGRGGVIHSISVYWLSGVCALSSARVASRVQSRKWRQSFWSGWACERRVASTGWTCGWDAKLWRGGERRSPSPSWFLTMVRQQETNVVLPVELCHELQKIISCFKSSFVLV